MTPCGLGKLSFKIDIPEPDELQISIVGLFNLYFLLLVYNVEPYILLHFYTRYGIGSWRI